MGTDCISISTSFHKKQELSDETLAHQATLLVYLIYFSQERISIGYEAEARGAKRACGMMAQLRGYNSCLLELNLQGTWNDSRSLARVFFILLIRLTLTLWMILFLVTC